MKIDTWAMAALFAALLTSPLPSPAERNQADPYLKVDSPFVRELYRRPLPKDDEGLGRI